MHLSSLMYLVFVCSAGAHHTDDSFSPSSPHLLPCCSDKIQTEGHTGGNSLSDFQVTVHHERKPGPELKEGTEPVVVNE